MSNDLRELLQWLEQDLDIELSSEARQLLEEVKQPRYFPKPVHSPVRVLTFPEGATPSDKELAQRLLTYDEINRIPLRELRTPVRFPDK